MEGETDFQNYLVELFDLPKDVILDLPAISIIGNLNLKIENHQGIIKYTKKLIKIRVKRGKVIVRGRNLSIDMINNNILILVGKIDSLNFELF